VSAAPLRGGLTQALAHKTDLPVTLYHATLRSYSPGDVVHATESNQFYIQAVAALEQSKPSGFPSRTICLFATDNLEFCYLFALKQQWAQDQISIYEVEIENYRNAPMAIVHALQRRIERGQDGKDLIREYWNPENSWHFMEYFGHKMTISRQVDTPSINQLALTMKYQSDADRAAQL
jgi:hypothetical protein